MYETALRLLHPFMPFLTEELWQRLAHGAGLRAEFPVSISLAHYPQPGENITDANADRTFGLLQQIVTAARELRADNKLDPKTTYQASLYLHAAAAPDITAVETITRFTITLASGIPQPGGLLRSNPDFDLRVEAQAVTTNGAGSSEMRVRLEKEIANLEKVIDSSERQLADDKFLSKAPEKIVNGMRAKLADYRAQLKKNRNLLEGL